MKGFILFLLISSVFVLEFNDDQEHRIEEVSQKLYNVEDKIDHLLYHYSHDLSKHSYQATPWGPHFVPDPANPHSIHEKLKLIDMLHTQMGHPAAIQTSVTNHLTSGFGPGSMFPPMIL